MPVEPPNSSEPCHRLLPGRRFWPIAVLIASCAGLGRVLAEGPTVGASGLKPIEAADGMLLGPVIFSPSIAVTQTWDSNIFRIHEGIQLGGSTVPVVADTLTTATARLAFTLPFSHSYISLVWYPGYRNYGSIDLAKTTSNALVFEARLVLSNGSVIDFVENAADGYLDTNDFDPGGVLTISSTPYSRKGPILTCDWVLDPRWGILGTLSRVSYNFQAAINPAVLYAGAEGQARVDFYDFTTDTLQVGVYHSFRQMRIFGAFRYALTDQDRTAFNETHDIPPSLAIPYETIREGQIAVGVQGNLTATLAGTFSVGYTTWRFKYSSADPFAGVSYSGNLIQQFGTRTSGNLALFRGPQQSAGDQVGYYLREEAYVNVERWLSTRFVGRIGMTLRRNTFFPTIEGSLCDNPSVAVPLACLEYQTLDVNPVAQIEYRIKGTKVNNPLIVGLTYVSESRTSDQTLLDMNDRRITLSLSAGWF